MAKQTFTTGQVLTAAQMTSLQQTAMGGGSTTAKTASYVLVAADAGTVVQMNSASATTITVNTALFAAGDTVQIQNVGAGVCTVTAGTATVTTAGSLALSQWEGGNLYFTSTSASIFFDIVQTSGMTNPLTTTGDTIYSSSGTTPARLGIGSTGQVLTVAAGVPSWATPAVSASGLTLVTSGTFSAASTVTISSCFTSTYRNYRIMVELTGGASNSYKLDFAFRSGGSTITTNYYQQSTQSNDAGTGAIGQRSPTNAAWRVGFQDFANSTQSTCVIMYDLFAPQVAAKTSGLASASAVYSTDYYNQNFSFWQNSTSQMDGIYLSNIYGATMTGVYKIYGYAD